MGNARHFEKQKIKLVYIAKNDIIKDGRHLPSFLIMMRLDKFFSEQKTIYPDCRFLEIPNELKFLENFDLDDSTICAVFGSILKK